METGVPSPKERARDQHHSLSSSTIRGSSANAFGSQRCVFASFRPIASAKETHNRAPQTLVFSFRGLTVVLLVAELNHVTFSFSNSFGLKSSLIGTKWPRVQPKPASPALVVALQDFFFSLTGVLNTTEHVSVFLENLVQKSAVIRCPISQ